MAKYKQIITKRKKTKAMIFHMPQKIIIIPKLQINETVIEFVDNFVFLGITINKHLNWINHGTRVTNKIAKNIAAKYITSII